MIADSLIGGGGGPSMAAELGNIVVDLLPGADNTYDIGSVAASWKDLRLDGDAHVLGNLTLDSDGNTTIAKSGSSIAYTVEGTTSFYMFASEIQSVQNFVPQTNGVPSLGKAAGRWKDVHLNETANLTEMTAPTGVANVAKVFAQDNGSGKTQLMCIFGSGAAQQLAIEP